MNYFSLFFLIFAQCCQQELEFNDGGYLKIFGLQSINCIIQIQNSNPGIVFIEVGMKYYNMDFAIFSTQQFELSLEKLNQNYPSMKGKNFSNSFLKRRFLIVEANFFPIFVQTYDRNNITQFDMFITFFPHAFEMNQEKFDILSSFNLTIHRCNSTSCSCDFKMVQHFQVTIVVQKLQNFNQLTPQIIQLDNIQYFYINLSKFDNIQEIEIKIHNYQSLALQICQIQQTNINSEYNFHYVEENDFIHHLRTKQFIFQGYNYEFQNFQYQFMTQLIKIMKNLYPKKERKANRIQGRIQQLEEKKINLEQEEKKLNQEKLKQRQQRMNINKEHENKQQAEQNFQQEKLQIKNEEIKFDNEKVNFFVKLKLHMETNIEQEEKLTKKQQQYEQEAKAQQKKQQSKAILDYFLKNKLVINLQVHQALMLFIWRLKQQSFSFVLCYWQQFVCKLEKTKQQIIEEFELKCLLCDQRLRDGTLLQYTKCNHGFHKECLKIILNSQCSNCKNDCEKCKFII